MPACNRARPIAERVFSWTEKMAGDWIKVEKATARKPEVLHLSTLLNVHPDHAFGLCFRFWSWCDDQLSTCHAAGVTFVTLDSVIGHAGFASALVKVGWLQVSEGSLVIPNFDRHLSDSAKNRALSGKRQQKKRESVTETSRSQRDKSVTREEKRREESIHISGYGESEIVIPEKMNTPEVKQAASLWIAHLQQRDPDKVPWPGSPCEQGFWMLATRMGPDGFVRAVETAVAGNWINLKDVSQPASGIVSRTAGRSQNRGLSIDEAFAKMEANGEIG